MNIKGKYLKIFSVNSNIFIFINIIVNINKIAIAPTQIIKMDKLKKSIPNNNINKQEFKKQKIKAKTECRGLMDKIMKIELTNIKNIKMDK